MASLRVYTVGRLAKIVTDSTYKLSGLNVYRIPANRGYSAEGRTAEKQANTTEPPPTNLEDCIKTIEGLNSEIKTLKENVESLNDKYKRALAEGENIRRRMIKQVDDAKSFAIQSFCKDLLDVADTLSAATESVPEQELSNASAALKALHDGVRLTSAQLTQVFSRHGLEKVYPLNEKFDPNLHEALFQQEVEGASPGTVVTVSKVGYKLRERCVRPALVGVAKAA